MDWTTARILSFSSARWPCTLKGKQRYERLLAKLKREGDAYRREFAQAS